MGKHYKLFAGLTVLALLIAQPAQSAENRIDQNSDPIVDVYPNSETDSGTNNPNPTYNIEPMVDIYPDQGSPVKYSNTDRGVMQNYNNAESTGTLNGSKVFERKEESSGSGSKWRVM